MTELAKSLNISPYPSSTFASVGTAQVSTQDILMLQHQAISEWNLPGSRTVVMGGGEQACGFPGLPGSFISKGGRLRVRQEGL